MTEVIVGGQPLLEGGGVEKARCSSTLFFVVIAGDLKAGIHHYQFFTSVG